MLYLVKEICIEGVRRDRETVIGIYESRELADKEIENIIEKCIRKAALHNQKIKLHECINCDDFTDGRRCDCTDCFSKIERIDRGFKVITYSGQRFHYYSIEGFELNKGLY